MAYTDANFEKLSKCCRACELADLGGKIDLLVSDIASDTGYSGELLTAGEIASLEGMCESARINSLGTLVNGLLTASKNYDAASTVSDSVKTTLNATCEAFRQTAIGTVLQTAATDINGKTEYDEAFITDLYFTGLSDYPAVIDDENETILVELPFGTTKTALVANFETSTGTTVMIGETVIESGTGEVDYTNPVTLTTVSKDESVSLDYVTTVSILENTEAELLTFAIGDAVGVIDEEAKTVAVEVANGVGLIDLVATFTSSENSTVEVGEVAQVSGVTANTFSSPVSYVVTSEDTLTENTYVITVTEAAL